MHEHRIFGFAGEIRGLADTFEWPATHPKVGNPAALGTIWPVVAGSGSVKRVIRTIRKS
jgi:hypothetical protein